MTFSKSWSGLLLVVLTVAVYLNCLPNHFVWDDEFLITNNSCIRNHLYVSTIFTTDLFHNLDRGTPYYRPLQTISYMLDYAFWGLDPWGYHLTSILLHLGCVLLIWLLIRQVSDQNRLAFLVAALFAVHPLNTNAITYIAGRADPLALAGMLGALWMFRKSRPAVRSARCAWYSGSVLLFTAALFSRESTLIFPALLFLERLAFQPEPDHRCRRALATVAPFVALSGTFLLWRQAVLAQFHRSVLPALWLPPRVRWQIPFRTFATDCGLLVWPAQLHMERQVALGGAELLVLTGLGLLLAGGLLWTLNRTYRTQPLIFFGVGWFILALLPTLAIPTIAVAAAEHWLYVPSIGFYVVLGTVAGRQLEQVTPRSRRLAGVLIVVVLGALALRTIRRNRDWADALTLYTQTKQAAPYSSHVWNNLGREFVSLGETQRALAELRAAEQTGMDNLSPQSNLCALYLAVGDLDHAQAKAEEILRRDPEQTGARLQLAAIAEKHGEFAAAAREFHRAIESTTAIAPRLQFAQFLLRRGQAAAARPLALETCALEPGHAAAFNLLGAVLAELDDPAGAATAFENAAARDRHSPDAWVNLGQLAFRQGDLPAAIRAYQRALQIQPDDGRSQFQLGRIFWKLGDRDHAAAHLRAAALTLPGNAAVLAALTAVRAGQAFTETPRSSGKSAGTCR